METNDTFFKRKTSLNCRGKILDLSTPKVMGILNLTPDSFYDGNFFQDLNAVRQHIHKMISQGADIIDIGAYSSRPGAGNIPPEEEWKRLSPVLDLIQSEFPEQIFSLDTFRSEIASKAAAKYPVSIINDISAGEMDPHMVDTIASLNIPYIMMHMKGTPQNMQQKAHYDDLLQEITTYFAAKTQKMHEKGVKDLILDPGFGFGKSVAHNYQLLGLINELKIFELPLMAGLSRKSMIYKLLDSSPSEALNGTTVLNTIALLKGVNLLRVHDVKEAREVIKLTETYLHTNEKQTS